MPISRVDQLAEAVLFCVPSSWHVTVAEAYVLARVLEEHGYTQHDVPGLGETFVRIARVALGRDPVPEEG